MCSRGVVPTLSGNMWFESLMKALTLRLPVYACTVLGGNVLSYVDILCVCLVQCVWNGGKVLSRARPSLFPLVSRNPWLSEGTVLHRLMVRFVLSRVLVVTRLVGLLLTMMVFGADLAGVLGSVATVGGVACFVTMWTCCCDLLMRDGLVSLWDGLLSVSFLSDWLGRRLVCCRVSRV